MKTRNQPKPREFKSQTLPARGVCVEHEGERIVDARVDLFDGRVSAAELRRYAKWLTKASRWAEGGSR